MSSYRGAWDGGPPGAEGEYVPPPAPHLPATDPWTGASYSQYPAYDYSAYSAAYGYGYDPSYYQQRPDGAYYPEAAAAYQPPPPPFDYPAERPREPLDDRESERRRSYNSKSRSASPYDRRDRSYSRKRDGSYEDSRRRRSRSHSRRKKYSSSDRSSSRSRSYSRSSMKKDKKRRSASSGSSASNKSYKKKASKNRRSDHSLTPPPKVKSSHSRKRSESPGTPDSRLRRSVSKSSSAKHHSSKDRKGKDKRRDVITPPRKKKSSTPPRGKTDRSSLSPPQSYKLTDRDSSLTPPRTYKYKDRNSDTPPRKARNSSVTSSKGYARSSSASSKSGSESPTPRRKKARGGRRSPTPSSSSGSSASSRLQSKSKRKAKRKSASKQRSRSRSCSKRRSRSRSNSRRRSSSKRRSVSPGGSKSRSRSRGKKSPSDEELRRGQFTVTDRKRYWKEHKYRQEERSKEARTPPKEVKPPPGAVEATTLDDIQYGDPPDVVGPNFAELLPPPDLAALADASTSRPKAVPIPIKNDGSFLEMFKKMQEATKKVEDKKPEIKRPALPFIGKRRGGRVLKTGLVKKAKAIDEQTVDNAPKDAWSLYMQEVKKYRETSCEEERKTRPLVK